MNDVCILTAKDVVFVTIEEKLHHSTREPLETTQQGWIPPHDAAMTPKRMLMAMSYRGGQIF